MVKSKIKVKTEKPWSYLRKRVVDCCNVDGDRSEYQLLMFASRLERKQLDSNGESQKRNDIDYIVCLKILWTAEFFPSL